VKNTYTDMINPYGTWYGWYAPPVWTVTRTEQYLEGTLLMDLVDPNTMQLIWRASATDTIRDFRTRDKNVDAAVKKIFGKFPPKQKKAGRLLPSDGEGLLHSHPFILHAQ
jgi:hypothetical protein